jgi:WD40 repeat protein
MSDEALQVSRDGAIVLRPEYIVKDGATKNRVRIWNANKESTQRLIGTNASTAALSPYGHTFATAGHDRPVRIWTTTGEVLRELSDEKNTLAISYSPDGNALAVADFEGVRIYSARQSDAKPIELKADHLRSFSISPDSSTVAIQSWNRDLPLFDAKGNLKASLPHEGHVQEPVFSADSKMVATYSADPHSPIYVWSVETGEILAKLPSIPHIRSVAFSPNGDFLTYASGSSGEVQVVNIKAYLASKP